MRFIQQFAKVCPRQSFPLYGKCSSKILPLKQTQKSIKAAAGLREPTEEEQEDFYLKLSNCNASILAIHQKFNKPFLPASQTKSLPKTVTSFADPNGITMTYDELIMVSMSIKDSYRVSADESRNLEECTQLQSKWKLWGSHRAGRVTVSNFKAIIKTKVEDPSRSLLKRLCHPETCTAQPPHGGVNMKVKELIAFLRILRWIIVMSIASQVD